MHGQGGGWGRVGGWVNGCRMYNWVENAGVSPWYKSQGGGWGRVGGECMGECMVQDSGWRVGRVGG